MPPGMLEQEEGDIPLGSVRGHTSTGGASTVVWKVLKEWVYAAALVAPTRTGASVLPDGMLVPRWYCATSLLITTLASFCTAAGPGLHSQHCWSGCS
jgi:hypothetical protein